MNKLQKWALIKFTAVVLITVGSVAVIAELKNDLK